ncbi:hypothetical protein CCH79_00002925 [Gambusia affinis]|uniref:Serine/arginine repetitive matrix protein 2-like n=1 Tax=Gambusia affinis TaxID=33528 RepID=A0A315W6W4_GAMAF|nr:hypothetical protein CCH79_00002925 [Gambusia affinis]
MVNSDSFITKSYKKFDWQKNNLLRAACKKAYVGHHKDVSPVNVKGEDEAPEKDDVNTKEGTEAPHKKNKKHRKHKSKKKKRRRKGEKESSSESGAESDVEPPPPPRRTTRARLAAAAGTENTGLKEEKRKDAVTDTDGGSKSKKHKRQAAKKKKKKRKKDEKQEKKSSRSPSDSSSASGSDSEGEGGKTAGNGKYSPAVSSDLKEPISRPDPKDSQGEEQVAPIVMQKPELAEVKKEEISDMEVPSTEENHSCTNDIEKDKTSPSTGQDEITQTDTVEVKIESNYGEAKFMHVQELPDIIPKQEGTTPKDDLILKNQTSLEVEAKVKEPDSPQPLSPSKSLEIKRSELPPSRSPSPCLIKKEAEVQPEELTKERSRTPSRSSSKEKLPSSLQKSQRFSHSKSRSPSPKTKKTSLSPFQKSQKRSSRRSRSTSLSVTPMKKASKSPSKSKSPKRRKGSVSVSPKRRRSSPKVSRSPKRGGRRSPSLSRSPRRRRRSKSRSRGGKRRSRTRSPRRSGAVGRRSLSRSITKTRRSHSRSRRPVGRSRSRSAARRAGGRRSRSRSLSRRRRSPPPRSRRSRSRSARRSRRSLSRSVVMLKRSRRSRSRSPRKRSKSRSPPPRKQSKSRSAVRRRSRSPGRKNRSPPRSGKRSKSRSLSRRHRSPQPSKKRSKSPRRSRRRSKSKSASRGLKKSKSRSRSESSDGRSESSSSARSVSNTPLKEKKASPPAKEKTPEEKIVEENGTPCFESGDLIPLPSAADAAPQSESPSDKLQDQPTQLANLPAPSSRSASQEPASGPGGSDSSEGSDDDEESPVKTVPKSKKSSSGSASPEVPKKQLSKSRSPADRRKRSCSTSKPASKRKLSRSKSPVRKKDSVSPSQRKKRRSKSRSPARWRRSRSRSTTRRKRSGSKSRTRNRRSKSRSPARKRRSRSPNARGRRRSKSLDRNKRSKSRSTGRRKRSRSGDRSRRSRSRSSDRRRRSRSRGRGRRPAFRSRSFDRRDRWKREPSHSPVVILRKQRRSGSRSRRSASKTPPRLTDLDKDQLLEIAKANAAAMCAKAGVPIPESLRPKAILQLPLPTPSPSPISLPLPLPLPMGMGMPNMSNMGPMGLSSIPGMPTMSNITMSAAVASMTAATMTAALTNMGALAAMPPLAPLPTITNKPPPSLVPPTPSLNLDHIEEAKRKVTQQANIHTIKELTEKCKMIANSKEEMAVAKPHVSDDENDLTEWRSSLFVAAIKHRSAGSANCPTLLPRFVCTRVKDLQTFTCDATEKKYFDPIGLKVLPSGNYQRMFYKLSLRQPNEDNRDSQYKKEKRGFERKERLDEIKADETIIVEHVMMSNEIKTTAGNSSRLQNTDINFRHCGFTRAALPTRRDKGTLIIVGYAIFCIVSFVLNTNKIHDIVVEKMELKRKFRMGDITQLIHIIHSPRPRRSQPGSVRRAAPANRRPRIPSKGQATSDLPAHQPRFDPPPPYLHLHPDGLFTGSLCFPSPQGSALPPVFGPGGKTILSFAGSDHLLMVILSSLVFFRSAALRLSEAKLLKGVFLGLGVAVRPASEDTTVVGSGAFSTLTRKNGLKVGAGSLCSVEEVCLAVGELIGHRSIRSAARMNGAVLFVEKVEQAQQLVEAGVSVNGVATHASGN